MVSSQHWGGHKGAQNDPCHPLHDPYLVKNRPLFVEIGRKNNFKKFRRRRRKNDRPLLAEVARKRERESKANLDFLIHFCVSIVGDIFMHSFDVKVTQPCRLCS